MKTCPHCTGGYADGLATCPTHGVLLNEIRDLKPGLVIRNTYRIVRKLGQGGMGAVYLAQHTLMDEPQALKFLSAELSADQDFTARFLREVRTLRQVRHRNVVDAGNLEPAEDGTLFFPMEFVDGPDLRKFMHEAPKPFDVQLALEITRGIAEGLGAAHAKGMVHRDIKPENILMAWEGDRWVPKIADFGIVATREVGQHTQTGSLLLTPFYAAPEQWLGTRAAELDGRTDIYALGGVLFEMLTGDKVFAAETYHGWAQQHLHVEPRRPSSVRPELANWKGLDAAVLRMMAKRQEDRPRDVAEAARLLDSVVYVAPPIAPPVTMIEEAGTGGGSGKRVPVWVWIASVAALVLAGFAAGRVFGPHQAGPLQGVSGQLPMDVQGRQAAPAPAPATAQSVLPPAVSIEPGQTLGGTREGGHLALEGSKKNTAAQGSDDFEKRAEAFFEQKDYARAKPLYEQACKAGNGTGCNQVGYMYQYRLGVAEDLQKANTFYDDACSLGNYASCYNLGMMYFFGTGVAKDQARAAALFTKACDGGSANGCGSLGICYGIGAGEQTDQVRAVALYTKACDGEAYDFCTPLGNSYRNGLGVSQDTEKARQSFAKGCSNGVAISCSSLKEMQ